MEDSIIITTAFVILLLIIIFWGVCEPGTIGVERLAPQLAKALGTNQDLSYSSHIGPGYFPARQ